MIAKDLIEGITKLGLPADTHVLLALPGGRFSPLTLVEPFSKVDDKGKAVTVVLVYPHPRDVAAMPGPSGGPTTRSELGEIVDKFFDLMGAGDGTKPEEE